MTKNMLEYESALNILDTYSKGADWARHCVAVSQLAAHLSSIFVKKYDINIEFLRSAALLHDIGRYNTHDPILHGVEGYTLLIKLGYPREAFVCVSHVLYGLNSEEAQQYGLPEKDFVPRSFEEKLIPLVDFLIEFDKPTTLDKRFARLRRCNANNQIFISKLDKAENLAKNFRRQLNSEFDISIEKIAKQAI